MAELAVTAMGTDQPGIVAAVAGVLHQHGGNITDSAMTILRGRFSMVLIVELDGDGGPALEDSLRAATAELGLHVTVAPAGQASDGPAATHLLSVYGSDHPGIVAGVSRALADVGANVTDLTTRVIGTADEPVYAMVVELSTDDEDAVRAALDDCARELTVDWTLRALDDVTY